MFLGNLRSAAHRRRHHPVRAVLRRRILVLRGESANLLSVGAIDFGLIVDATVIMVESIFRRLGETHGVSDDESHRDAGASGLPASCSPSSRPRPTSAARSSFAAGIIIAAFIPLFTLSGVEGHIFGPMAKTYAYALAGGLLATFTVTPALCAILLPEHVSETETMVVRLLHRLYTPVLRFAIANRLRSCCGRGGAVRAHRRGGRACSGWSSCPSSRKATCGSAPPCRRRSRWRKATPTSIGCAS